MGEELHRELCDETEETDQADQASEDSHDAAAATGTKVPEAIEAKGRAFRVDKNEVVATTLCPVTVMCCDDAALFAARPGVHDEVVEARVRTAQAEVL